MTNDNPLRIHFAHNYFKLHFQATAKLIAVDLLDRNDISEVARLYDTAYLSNLGQVEHGFFDALEYLRITLIGNRGIPFTTYRKNNPENRAKYIGAIGQTFDLVISRD